ncbi:hypothetical protein RJ40_08995 [Methanofollis aquaemaris]|uniref:Uncharacterized protein n=1 Tax=Methanofollis aquaemaris TaxID=126734 RepID=A0A8A3S6R5_9EURY|nr:hypothetical protein [Methanofollis aquaemaris]QSZ67633.1 hypothetical protein RJ40_08995 [Methanofollis aquaemaris]
MHKTALVVGGGVYGATCTRHLLGEGWQCVVIDQDSLCLAARSVLSGGTDGKVSFVRGGVAAALDHFTSHVPDYLIPTVPFHLLAALVSRACGFVPSELGASATAAALPPDLILSSSGGTLVLSYNREGSCLPVCPAPSVCPATGEHRTRPLHTVLRHALPTASVLESVQLAPGVGGLRGDDVAAVLTRAREEENIVVGTACRCHGVVTALTKRGV